MVCFSEQSPFYISREPECLTQSVFLSLLLLNCVSVCTEIKKKAVTFFFSPGTESIRMFDV